MKGISNVYFYQILTLFLQAALFYCTALFLRINRIKKCFFEINLKQQGYYNSLNFEISKLNTRKSFLMKKADFYIIKYLWSQNSPFIMGEFPYYKDKQISLFYLRLHGESDNEKILNNEKILKILTFSCFLLFSFPLSDKNNHVSMETSIIFYYTW